MTATATTTIDDETVKRILETPEDEMDPEEAAEYLKLLSAEEETNNEILVNALTGATAVLHIYIGGKLFILNGLGFLALLAARGLLPKRESYQDFARDSLIGYTGITVLGYFAKFGAGGFTSLLGMSSKLIELGLIKALLSERAAAKRKLEFVAARAK